MTKDGASEHLGTPPQHSSRKQPRSLRRGRERTSRVKGRESTAPTVGVMGTKKLFATSYWWRRKRRLSKPKKPLPQPRFRPQPPVKLYLPTPTPMSQRLRRTLRILTGMLLELRLPACTCRRKPRK